MSAVPVMVAARATPLASSIARATEANNKPVFLIANPSFTGAGELRWAPDRLHA